MKVGITTTRLHRCSVILTSCYGQVLNDDGEFEDFSAVFLGGTDTTKATKYYRNLLDNDTIVINNVEEKCYLCTMPFSEFLEKCKMEEVER